MSLAAAPAPGGQAGAAARQAAQGGVKSDFDALKEMAENFSGVTKEQWDVIQADEDMKPALDRAYTAIREANPDSLPNPKAVQQAMSNVLLTGGGPVVDIHGNRVALDPNDDVYAHPTDTERGVFDIPGQIGATIGNAAARASSMVGGLAPGLGSLFGQDWKNPLPNPAMRAGFRTPVMHRGADGVSRQVYIQKPGLSEETIVSQFPPEGPRQQPGYFLPAIGTNTIAEEIAKLQQLAAEALAVGDTEIANSLVEQIYQLYQ
jgi:hypothetical protein